ncbi:MAG: DUF3084 domain-containing protein [Thermovirgaceae bacterium]|nr:DUF3084 domain-containing protein [Thermovirgaceae bacterium]
MIMEMNWMLILILIVVSAIVAYIGDIVGMRFGKKRVSIFGMRPKNTSSLITVVSGILITIFTLAVLSATSQTVRTAIFSMKFVQKQITELTSQLQGSRTDLIDLETRLLENQKDLVNKQIQLANIEGSLDASETRLREIEAELSLTRAEQEKASINLAELKIERGTLEEEVNSLNLESEKLRERLKYVRGGRIVVFAGEMIAQTVVAPATSGGKPEPDDVLDILLRSAKSMVSMRYGVEPDEVKVWVNPESIEIIKKSCRDPKGRRILRLMASENTVQGEMIAASVTIHESRKIYDRNQILAEERGIPSGLPAEQAETRLYSILGAVNSRAQRDGVLPDPIRGTVGNLSASDFFDAVDSLAQRTNTATVTVSTESDVYTEGPVRVIIRILAE